MFRSLAFANKMDYLNLNSFNYTDDDEGAKYKNKIRNKHKASTKDFGTQEMLQCILRWRKGHSSLVYAGWVLCETLLRTISHSCPIRLRSVICEGHGISILCILWMGRTCPPIKMEMLHDRVRIISQKNTLLICSDAFRKESNYSNEIHPKSTRFFFWIYHQSEIYEEKYLII